MEGFEANFDECLKKLVDLELKVTTLINNENEKSNSHNEAKSIYIGDEPEEEENAVSF